MRRSKSVPATWTPWLARMSSLRSTRRLALGADANEREVGGAAADVGDQDLLLARHRLLVVERGGDRLVLEDDLAKAGAGRRAAQRRLGLGVALGVVVDEVDRPADDGAIDRRRPPPPRRTSSGGAGRSRRCRGSARRGRRRRRSSARRASCRGCSSSIASGGRRCRRRRRRSRRGRTRTARAPRGRGASPSPG